jgi:hypothetical protein
MYTIAMGMVSVFLLGCGVLVGALLLNVVASALGLMSWYDFVKDPGQATAVSYVWLFVVYPLGLGVVAYYSAKLLGLLA